MSAPPADYRNYCWDWHWCSYRSFSGGFMTSMAREPDAILKDVRSYNDAETNEKLPALFTELELAVLQWDLWPTNFFQEIVEVQLNRDFRKLDNSWTLLHFINNNWTQLLENQKQQLREILRNGFDKYSNWMAAFITSEILGNRYADKGALQILVELGETASAPARAAIPHGLETLAMSTSDDSLRRLAVNHLNHLSGSESEDVRKEALLSLEKLSK
jgi:hypothetical protein